MDTNKLLEEFVNIIRKEQANVPYNFNVLDEQCGHIVENSHTNILMKILEYKNMYQDKYLFLESFFNYLNIPIQIESKDVIVFDRERFSNGKQKTGRIDGFIYQKNKFALIIENKVNHAPTTKKQIETYIKGIQNDKTITDINKKNGIDKIWVMYLTEDGIDKPQKSDVDYMINKGICSNESQKDDYAEIQGERYFAVNYQDDILPWLKEEIQPIVMQREQVLNTGLLQYIDYLEGMFGKRQQDVDLMEKCQDAFNNLTEIKDLKDINEFASRNKKLKTIYKDLEKIKKTDDKESRDKYYAACILKNQIEKINEEPLKKFFDYTRYYFKDKKLLTECIIHPSFDFYYIQIRDSSWPRSIHFEWFPLGIDKITGKKKKDYTLCFHVETRKEIWCKFERLFDSTTFEKSKTRKQTLEYNKTISFEQSISDMLNDDNDEGLKEFIEKAYSGITPDLIHKINEQIKKMKKA